MEEQARPASVRDAADKGYEAIVTLDVDQLSDADECRALKRSKLHHISLRQGRRGMKPMTRARSPSVTPIGGS
jgi:hypothetical protein